MGVGILIHIFFLLTFITFPISCQFQSSSQYQCKSIIQRQQTIISLSTSPSDLLCWMSFQEYRSKSAYYLSIHYLLNHNYIGGYHYAIRLLELEPFNCYGHLLLSWIYFQMDKEYSSSFYMEIAFSLNESCHINHPPFDDFISLPIILSKCDKLSTDDSLFEAVTELIDGKRTLGQIFLLLQTQYHHLIPDFSIYSLERFIQTVQVFQNCHETKTCINPTFLIPTTFARVNFDQLWLMDKVLYIYNWPVVQNIFGETVVGLSDAFSRLGMPNAIISTTSEMKENDVIIKPVGGPMSVRLDINYVIWNFEKNPNLAKKGDQINIGFTKNACDREESAYEYSYFTLCTTYWESIPTSMIKWRAIQPQLSSILQSKGIPNLPHLVPTFLPLSTIQFSVLMRNFKGRIYSLFNSIFFDFSLKDLVGKYPQDSHQPIDILFLGSYNLHREIIRQKFLQLSRDYNIRVDFHFQYDAFEFARENLIDQAKVLVFSCSIYRKLGCLKSWQL